MSWQEELSELDRTLAEGRISADDYRRRRDELLASASSGGGTPGGQQGQSPFAPPFRWEASPPQQQPPNPDATQVVGPGAANPDATQVVSGRPPADAERTQYVRPVAHPGPPPGQQQPPQNWPPQQQQPQQAGTPWGGGDGFGSYGDAGPSWIAQGPEVFDEGGGGGKKKVIGIVVAVVLLAGIAFGAYMIWGRGESTASGGNTETTSTTPTTTTTTAPPDPMPIGKLAGKVTQNKSVTAFSAVPNLKYLLDSEAQAYTTAGAGKAKLAQFTLDSGASGVILIVQASDDKAANAAALALHEIQLGNGMTVFKDSPTTVLTGQIDSANGSNARVRGHYGSDGMIVRVDVAAPNLTAAQKGFTEVLEAELKVLKADG
ncbi:hypothetical protein [Saccharothrix obliqua]|uniref:hypothetical protein n=1 Tax=Saccharothrix obliqua TaxID=2861747 RepID=UPI001C6021F4|nr:hypothetical protein [Saccharothrix obliqua]MBW4719538.1 hypothetical protein [Saccharothrix obliqua]